METSQLQVWELQGVRKGHAVPDTCRSRDRPTNCSGPDLKKSPAAAVAVEGAGTCFQPPAPGSVSLARSKVPVGVRTSGLEISVMGVCWCAGLGPILAIFFIYNNSLFFWEVPPPPLQEAAQAPGPPGDPSLAGSFFTQNLDLEWNGPRATRGALERPFINFYKCPRSLELPSLLHFQALEAQFFPLNLILWPIPYSSNKFYFA